MRFVGRDLVVCFACREAHGGVVCREVIVGEKLLEGFYRYRLWNLEDHRLPELVVGEGNTFFVVWVGGGVVCSNSYLDVLGAVG